MTQQSITKLPWSSSIPRRDYKEMFLILSSSVVFHGIRPDKVCEHTLDILKQMKMPKKIFKICIPSTYKKDKKDPEYVTMRKETVDLSIRSWLCSTQVGSSTAVNL